MVARLWCTHRGRVGGRRPRVARNCTGLKRQSTFRVLFPWAENMGRCGSHLLSGALLCAAQDSVRCAVRGLLRSRAALSPGYLAFGHHTMVRVQYASTIPYVH